MRIHVLSDLHFEFAKMPRSYTPPECDVVILSGDISAGLPGVIWAKETFTVPVIYVAGNHEFYIKARTHADQILKMKEHAEGSTVHVMENETIVIDGVRFIGATLWTDFDLYGQNFFHQQVAQRSMNDYSFIWKTEHERLSADDTLEMHKASRQYITEQLSTPFEGKTVVATHHAPSVLSVHPRWENHPVTPAYASRLENLILDYGPVLWTHGHVHDSFDYELGDTRVIANPRGYEGHEINEKYDPQLVVEI